MSYEVLTIRNFGLTQGVGSPTTPFQISATAGIEALEIDSSSELDACWISYPSASSGGGGLIAGDTGYRFDDLGAGRVNKSENQVPDRATTMLSIEHPVIGPIRGNVIVQPVYKWSSGGSIYQNSIPGIAMLAIRIWKSPPSQSIGVSKRAVLRAGWTGRNAGGSVAVVPTFGRKLVRVWARTLVANNLFVDYGWTQWDGTTRFGTALPIAVPITPSFASLLTSDIPDWMTFYDAEGAAVSDLLVEAYD